MSETEEKERNTKRNANNMTMNTFYHQHPVPTNTQGVIANVTNERRIYLDILAEKIKRFNGLTIQSTINDSAYYNSEKDDAESDPNINPKVATHTSDGKKRKLNYTDTTNRNYPRKLLINRLIPEIIPVAIQLIYQTIAEDAAESGETFHARRTILLK